MVEQSSQSVIPWRFLTALAALIAGLIVVARSVTLMRDQEAPKLIIMAVALVVGVGGVWGLYWINNYFVSLIPSETIRSKLQPYISSWLRRWFCWWCFCCIRP